MNAGSRRAVAVAAAGLLVAGVVSLAVLQGRGSSHVKVGTPTSTTTGAHPSSAPSTGSAASGSGGSSTRGPAVTGKPASSPVVGGPVGGPSASTAVSRSGSAPTINSGMGGWYQQTVPNTGPLTAVSCVDGGDCLAVGGSVIGTTDGGAHWNLLAMPALASNSDVLLAVSCVDASTCWTASRDGVLSKTIDGGQTWSRQPLPGPTTSLTALTCLDAQHCWAAGIAGPNVILRTVDGGTDWSTADTPGGGVQGLSCLSVQVCWAAGNTSYDTATSVQTEAALRESTDGGATWTVKVTYQPQYAGIFNGVSCVGTQDCSAVGNSDTTTPLLATTSDGGAHWTLQSVPSGVQELRSISCTASGCWSVGAEGEGKPGAQAVIVESGPAGSAATTRLTTTLPIVTIDCISSGSCWAAGGNTSATMISDTPH